MVRIYLAGPLFCESERRYNADVAGDLRSKGFDVVLPQENDSLFESGKMGDKAYALESAKKVFKADLELLDSCDVLVINLDGRVPDEGACIELGYAYARGKKVYGLKTDVRISEYGIDNMMIAGMLGRNIMSSVVELVRALSD